MRDRGREAEPSAAKAKYRIGPVLRDDGKLELAVIGRLTSLVKSRYSRRFRGVSPLTPRDASFLKGVARETFDTDI